MPYNGLKAEPRFLRLCVWDSIAWGCTQCKEFLLHIQNQGCSEVWQYRTLEPENLAFATCLILNWLLAVIYSSILLFLDFSQFPLCTVSPVNSVLKLSCMLKSTSNDTNLNLSTRGRGRLVSKLKASLVCKVSSRTARAPQRKTEWTNIMCAGPSGWLSR